MVNSEYLFNNEAIGIIAITSVLKECKELSYGKSMLILPFLFHDEITSFLKRANVVVRSSEEMIVKKITLFGNFNSRYYSLLPITINSLMILKEMRVIKINGNKIFYTETTRGIDLDVCGLGKRAGKIIKASKRLSDLLLLEDENSLYLKLRIQL